jgi:DNA-binding PadR family transcriptional regulator
MYRRASSGVHRSSLEVFILVLISQGLTTTYALQSLSLGASVPALKRLQDAGLVSKKIVGRRHEFSLTRLGKVAMSDWKIGKARFPTDLDDVLRTAFLAGLMRDRSGATNILHQAAKARRRAAEERSEEADRLQKDIGTKFDLNAYQWLRAKTEAARLSAEEVVLDSCQLRLNPSANCPTSA